ncbi:MAG: tetratricopeptide repeat protein, partial [Planctomycetales bacterium]|nr:tetratricopeptide repeat protein [Planctomycetales bacterium]
MMETADNETRVIIRFDTGDGTLSLAEWNQLRDEISQLEEKWSLTLNWEHAAAKFVEQRKFAEAFRLYREAIRRNPADSGARGMYLDALVKFGFVDEARRFARAAVVRFPDSAEAHFNLAIVLTRNLAGVPFRHGYAREEALLHLRRSLELDPEMAMAKFNIAIILEHDEFGNRYADPKGLAEAVRLYRELLTLDNPVLRFMVAKNLPPAMLHSGQIKELRELWVKENLAASVEDELTAALWEMVLAAKLDSPEAALEVADRFGLTESQKEDYLVGASEILVYGRHYEEGAAVYDLAKPGVENSILRNKSRYYRSLKHFETTLADPKTPTRVVQEFLATLCAYGNAPNKWSTHVANYDSAPYLPSFLNGPSFADIWTWRQSPKTVSGRQDFLSKLQWKFDQAGESGYRVDISANDIKLGRVYLVPEGDSYRVWLPGWNEVELGRRAWHLLDEGKIDEAKQWLIWAEDELPVGSLFNPFDGSPFRRLWNREQGSESELRFAAACLLSRGSVAELNKAIEVLETELKNETAGPRV